MQVSEAPEASCFLQDISRTARHGRRTKAGRVRLSAGRLDQVARHQRSQHAIKLLFGQAALLLNLQPCQLVTRVEQQEDSNLGKGEGGERHE